LRVSLAIREDGLSSVESDLGTLKERVARHYDELSPFYRDLWGVHIHHGYWKTGHETKEEAQEQLITELVSRAQIKRDSRILDVGCGMGGSAISLSKMLGAHVTGITISPTQVAIGNDLAKACGADVVLLQADAETFEMEEPADVAWSIEAISHMSEKTRCFSSIGRNLRHGGTLVVADWFAAPQATADQEREFLEPIERSMLVPKLERQAFYAERMREAGLEVRLIEDVSAHVSKTWDLAIGLIGSPALWKFAAERGKDFLAFLEGFKAMRAGYRSRTLVYGLLVAHKS
jgi:tocopherol O-methyltransferase